MRLVVVNLSVRSISGGYEAYLNQFFARVENDRNVEAILFVAVPEVAKRYAGRPKIEILHLSRLLAVMSTIWPLRNAIRTFNPDLVFVPMEKRARGYHDVPVVTMLQNMEPFVPLTKGNSMVWSLLLAIMHMRAVSAIRNSDHVIALSDFVRQRVGGSAGIPNECITVIPHGTDPGADIVPMRPSSISNGENFIFTAGILSPARGIDDLINAFIDLRKGGKLAGFTLCIAGEKHKYNRRWVESLVQYIGREGLADEVKWLGFLSKAEMKWCFQNASLFVLTSRVESFCITAVEAMMNKVPVVSSNSPCLPETLGNYPVYYDAADWKQLAEKIEYQLKQDGRVSGIFPNNLISWDENFERTMSLFRKILNK